MIKKRKNGSFVLEIVHTESNKPFPEHTGPDGKTYVEVEPYAEYFLRFTNESSSDVVLDPYIDGDYLGYLIYAQSDKFINMGIYNRRNGISKFTSLKFDKLSNMSQSVSSLDNEGKKSSTREEYFGSVKVDIYNIGYDKNKKYSKNFTSRWSSNLQETQTDKLAANNVGNNKNRKDPKDVTNSWSSNLQETETDKLAAKRVASNVGTRKIPKCNTDYTKIPDKYIRSSLIDSISLVYCSTPGLSIAGIIPRIPRSGKKHPLDQSFVPNSKIPCLKIEPEIIKHTMTDAQGNVIEVVEIEIFDLTNLDDISDKK